MAITIKKGIWAELDEMRSQYLMQSALNAQAQDAAMEKLEMQMGFESAQKELDRLQQKELKGFEINMRILDRKEEQLLDAQSDLKILANKDADAKYAFSTLSPIQTSDDDAASAIALAEAFNTNDANKVKALITDINSEIKATEDKVIELNDRMAFINEAEDAVNELALIAGPTGESFVPSDISKLSLDIPYRYAILDEKGRDDAGYGGLRYDEVTGIFYDKEGEVEDQTQYTAVKDFIDPEDMRLGLLWNIMI